MRGRDLIAQTGRNPLVYWWSRFHSLVGFEIPFTIEGHTADIPRSGGSTTLIGVGSSHQAEAREFVLTLPALRPPGSLGVVRATQPSVLS
jgi:hypothetical protein